MRLPWPNSSTPLCHLIRASCPFRLFNASISVCRTFALPEARHGDPAVLAAAGARDPSGMGGVMTHDMYDDVAFYVIWLPALILLIPLWVVLGAIGLASYGFALVIRSLADRYSIVYLAVLAAIVILLLVVTYPFYVSDIGQFYLCDVPGGHLC